MNNRPKSPLLNEETASLSWSDLENAQRESNELFEETLLSPPGSEKGESNFSNESGSLRESAQVDSFINYDDITLVNDLGETIFAEPEIASNDHSDNDDDVTLINENGKTPFDELFEKLENNNQTTPSPKRSPSPTPFLRKSLSEESDSPYSSEEESDISEPIYRDTPQAQKVRLQERLHLLKQIKNLSPLTWKADKKELVHIMVWSTLLSAAIVGIPLSIIIKRLTHNKDAARLTPVIAGVKGGLTMGGLTLFCTKNYPKNSAKLKNLLEKLNDNLRLENDIREETLNRNSRPR